MKAIIFESDQQTEFQAMSSKINSYLPTVIDRYKADNYLPWIMAQVNVTTNQRALKIKLHIEEQIKGALTPTEIASIVDISIEDKNWWPDPPEE